MLAHLRPIGDTNILCQRRVHLYNGVVTRAQLGTRGGLAFALHPRPSSISRLLDGRSAADGGAAECDLDNDILGGGVLRDEN